MAEKEQQQRTDSAGDGAEAKASSWNPNSSHWEEKQLTSWCITTLEQRLSEAKLILLEGSAELTFFNVKVKGEANLSYKREKKIIFFELKIEADWRATARDANGIFLASSTGNVLVEEFNEDCLLNQSPSVSFQGDGRLAPQQRIDAAAKTEGKQQLLQLLSLFAKDISDKA